MYDDCEFRGPLLTTDFIKIALSNALSRRGVSKIGTAEGWCLVRRGLCEFAATGGPVRVLNHFLNPMARALGYREIHRESPVSTRDGQEDGGHLMGSADGQPLRVWPIGSDLDLDSSSRHGSAARISPLRRAVRVLRACRECIGLVTNGIELRVVLCDPGGSDSGVAISLNGPAGWASRSEAPESFHLVHALVSSNRAGGIDEFFDAARLHQSSVTKTLRLQARSAIVDFVQCVLDRQDGFSVEGTAESLWRQALIIVYRLLFVLKLENTTDKGGGFSFASADAWRRGFSPNRALGPLVRRHLDLGHDTGEMLETGLRNLFQICRDGLRHSSLSIAPLGGGLFDPAATRALDSVAWGERAVALLLDRLLWTIPRGRERERVHYGLLGVEELGGIYESLLELKPEIAMVPMVRMRQGRVEAVLPMSPERAASPAVVEHIDAGKFYLRAGLGRRAGGSYYTPREFVRFLVRDTLSPLVKTAIDNASPGSVLRIKVFDPAMGSGHFLVEACRFLAEALFVACCRCAALGTAQARRELDGLPDENGILSSYLPSRSHGSSDDGVSKAKGLAICRRLVSVHCLYGTDRDPMAVELSKLSLWLESFAEGMPLTFLDHRLVAGDSVAGPFFANLEYLPIGGNPLDPLLARGVTARLRQRVDEAIAEVRKLEGSVGTSVSDDMVKRAAKQRLDLLFAPLSALARAWSGAVRTNSRDANDAWIALARSVAESGILPEAPSQRQDILLERGRLAVPLDILFPEIFWPEDGNGGFHVVLGNPPWEIVHYQTKEFLAEFDPSLMKAPTKRERQEAERHLLEDVAINHEFQLYRTEFVERKRLCDRLFPASGASGSIDLFEVFTERMLDSLMIGGVIGIVVPSSLHANEGTAHLRRRILNNMRLECCFMFDNRKKFFEIHGRQKFSLLIARRSGSTQSFRAAFYLDSISQIEDQERVMTYDRQFVSATGGRSETLLELRGQNDFRVASRLFVGRQDMQSWLASSHITFGREAHMTDDSFRFSPINRMAPEAGLPMHEGKTFHQYTDRWKAEPRYALRWESVQDKPGWLRAARHYRIAFREISRSTDERTMIAAIIPPGYLFGHKGTCEKKPWERPDAEALILCSLFNSFVFDWCVRQKIAASVSLFMLNCCPVPDLSMESSRFLAHGALRLSCRHAGYTRLWKGQLGSAHGFVPDGLVPSERHALRSAIDAVVAQEYGLSRADFRQILSGFSHKSLPEAPDLCLAAFDLLRAQPQEFYRYYDPFCGVPLVTALSQPAMESPTASATLMPSMAADRIPPA